MISNECATMRTARSFLPLLRPFIIMLISESDAYHPTHATHTDAPVDQTLDNGHLRLLELLLGITAGGVGEIYGVADLDVVGQGDVLNLNTRIIARAKVAPPCQYAWSTIRHKRSTHSWVSHLPKSLTSDPSLETSLGRDVTAAILMGCLEEGLAGTF